MKSPKGMTPEEKQEHLKSLEAEISKLEDLGRALTLLRSLEWINEKEKESMDK